MGKMKGARARAAADGKKKTEGDINRRAVSLIAKRVRDEKKSAPNSCDAPPTKANPLPSSQKSSSKPWMKDDVRNVNHGKAASYGKHGSYSSGRYPNYSAGYQEASYPWGYQTDYFGGRGSRGKRNFGGSSRGGWGGGGSGFGSYSQWGPGGGGFHEDDQWNDRQGYEHYDVSNFDVGNQNQRYRAQSNENRNKKNYTNDKSARRKETELSRPKRSDQNINALKKKHPQHKKLKASELLKDLEESSEIADKAAKIKEMLGSLSSNYMFGPSQHDSTECQQSSSPEPDKTAVVPPRVKIDKVMVPDLVLTASDFAEVGTGKNFAPSAGSDEDSESCVGSTRPSILPVFHDDQVVPPPPSGMSDAVPRPRVAYTTALADNVFMRRKRTLSESSCLLEPPPKNINRRERTNSEAAPGSNSVDEAMGQIIDKRRVDKLKTSLLKMNSKSLKELVENPTSKTSRTLMKALVQENRNFISSCLNRSRFGKFQLGGNDTANVATVLADDDLDKLPSNVMVEISDIIKQEVPDMDVIFEAKQEQDVGIDLNVKCEVQYGSDQDQESNAQQCANDLEPFNVQDARNEEASTSRPKITEVSNDPITLAPVPKKRGRPPKGKTRRIGGYEVIIGSVSDLVHVQGSDNTDKAPDNLHEEICLEELEAPTEQRGEKDASNNMKSLGLIFEQESR